MANYNPLNTIAFPNAPVTPPTPNYQDPRSLEGMFAKGMTNYGGSFSPPGAGRPPNPTPRFQDPVQAQGPTPQNDVVAAITRRTGQQGEQPPTSGSFVDAIRRRINASSGLA